MEHSFITITSRFTQTQSGSTYVLIFGLNGIFQPFTWIIIISYLKPYNCMYIIHYTGLHDKYNLYWIDIFDYLNVYNQIINIK